MSNRSFSLTHPEPSKPATRNNPRYGSFQPRDFSSEAITNWLDAQLVSDDLDTAMTRAATISDRLTKGDAWLRDRGPSSPDWQRANALHTRLCDEQMHGLHRTKFLYVSLYLRCCAVHGCLNQIDDPAAWIERHANGTFQNTPHSIWAALQPIRKPPFQTYPPDMACYHIGPGPFSHESLKQWMERT